MTFSIRTSQLTDVTALHRTRRQLLSAAGAGFAAALAGCSRETTSVSESESERRTPREGPPPGATTDFEARSLRAPVEEVFVRLGSEEDEASDRHAVLFVLGETDATNLRFEGDVDPADVDDVRAFAEATDFENASLVVIQRPIGDCYERRTEYVELEDGGFSARFCRVLRDATTRCDADERTMEATLLRVPHAYEDEPRELEFEEGSRCVSDFREDR